MSQQLQVTSSIGTKYYLWTQSTKPPLTPATIHFLSKNAEMPDTVQKATKLPADKTIVENPITKELKIYDRGSEPWL